MESSVGQALFGIRDPNAATNRAGAARALAASNRMLSRISAIRPQSAKGVRVRAQALVEARVAIGCSLEWAAAIAAHGNPALAAEKLDGARASFEDLQDQSSWTVTTIRGFD